MILVDHLDLHLVRVGRRTLDRDLIAGRLDLSIDVALRSMTRSTVFDRV